MKQKKGSGRKILSFLLSFAMIVSLIPAMTLTASAAEADEAIVTSQDEILIAPEESVPAQNENAIEPGEITSGQYENLLEEEEVVPEPDENSIEQEDAVPEQEENAPAGASLMAANSYSYLIPTASDSAADLAAKQVTFNGHKWYIIDGRTDSFAVQWVTLFAADTSFGTSVFSYDGDDYSTSTIKAKLDAMTESGGSFAHVANAIMPNVLADGGKLYLLSTDEANSLPKNVLKNGYFPKDYLTDNWWLRTPYGWGCMNCVYGGTGSASHCYTFDTEGIRPACTILLAYFDFSSEDKEFKLKPHNHSFTYSANGATITATCDDADKHCPLPINSNYESITTLTIGAPTLTNYGGTGSELARLFELSNFNYATGKTIDVSDIRYYKATKDGDSYIKGEPLSSAPTDMGDYIAEITLTGVKTSEGDNKSVTASTGYTIGVPNYSKLVPTNSDNDAALAKKTVRFNNYNWYIIKDESTNANSGTVTLMIKDMSFGWSKYHDSSNNYSTSIVKAYLDRVVAGTAGNGKPNFKDAADAMIDTGYGKLYLLSKEEANALPGNLRKPGIWWLRSPGTLDNWVTFVDSDGYVNQFGSNVKYDDVGVRPALTLDLSSVSFSSVDLSGGKNAAVSGGSTVQNVFGSDGIPSTITTVTYTAKKGYEFPETSNLYTTTNGITVARTSDTVVTVSGTPNGDADIAVPDALPIQTITVSDVTATYGDTDKGVSATTNGNGTISYAVRDGSGDYIEVNAATGALTIKKVPADGKAYVTVTAAGTETYAKATKDVTVNISKADPVAAVPTGLSATYGDTLAKVKLTNPDGNTPGTWAWTDSAASVGNAGINTFKAHFTPMDMTNYNSKENVDVTVTVGKAANPATVTDTATVWRRWYTADLSKNIELNGATGAVSYEIIGDALGCKLDGSILTSSWQYGCVTVNVTIAEDENHYALAVTPITVTIKDVTYLEASWSETEKMVEYTEKSVELAEKVRSYEDVWGIDTEQWSGWYVVADPDVVIKTRVNVDGTVNLILCDGAKLTIDGGIGVEPGNTLNIYAQSYYGDDMGVLEIDTTKAFFNGILPCAAIGGSNNKDCGTVTIHGGIVNAKCYGQGAAIGGGSFGGNGGAVTIYGGDVTADAGYQGWAAGIGGGGLGDRGGAGGTVTIYDGTVTATSIFGAGIGGGFGTDSGAGGTVTIYEGVVTASSTRETASRKDGTGSVGIGMGSHEDGGQPADNGDITLGENIYLFGGADAASAERIEQKDGDYERFPYMQALNPSGGVDDPDMCWHEWESIDAVPATFAEAGSAAGIICKECGEYLLKPTKIDKIRSVTLNKKKFTYNGSVQKPVVTVTDSTGAVITANNYIVSYSNKKSRDVGVYTVTVTFKGSYSGKKTFDYSIIQAKNPLTVSPTSKTYKQTALKSAASFTIKATKAQGKVTYTRDAKAKKAKIKVTSKGKVTIPKNCKKGTYRITVKAKGNKNYKAGTKTVTIRIK